MYKIVKLCLLVLILYCSNIFHYVISAPSQLKNSNFVNFYFKNHTNNNDDEPFFNIHTNQISQSFIYIFQIFIFACVSIYIIFAVIIEKTKETNLERELRLEKSKLKLKKCMIKNV
jgi:uncharacterized membrane protein SpoIIM required for sporulation